MVYESNFEKVKSKKERNKKGYNKNPVMAFFANLLSLFGLIRDVYKTSGSCYIKLSASLREEYLDIHQENFSQRVIRLFIDVCADSHTLDKKVIKVSAEMVREQQERLVEAVYALDEITFAVDNEKLIKRDLEILSQIDKTLDTIILEDTIRQNIKARLDELRSIYTKSDSRSLWERETIYGFLNSYYRLLCMFVSEPEFLMSDGAVEKIVVPVLGLGLSEVSKEKSYLSMNSPLALSALNVIYDRLNEYVAMQIYSQNDGKQKLKEIENNIYNSIFLAKIHQIFRGFLIREKGGELFHAALPAYDFISAENKLQIPVRLLETYDSFQGIRELRFAEKILYEMELFVRSMPEKQEKDRGNFPIIFSIVLVGEVEEEPLKELIEYVQAQIISKSKYKELRNLLLEFHVYTKKISKEDNVKQEKPGYSYEFQQYNNHLCEIQKLNDLLEKGNLIMLLDNCDLYSLEIQEISDKIIFKQSINSESYETFFKQDKSRDLKLKCKFIDLYNVITAYCWKGKIGRLKRLAKENIVKYIQKYLAESLNKTCYIYVSDIDAFANLPCVQKQFVRIEEYNQKEIGLIRFTTYPKELIPISAACAKETGRNILAFNMWQFVKHILIDQKDIIKNLLLRKLSEQDTNSYFLDDIYIGIEYSNWKENLEVYYWFENADSFNAENIEMLVRIFVHLISYSDEINMYQKYVKQSTVSFLYGSAQSVEDLLFLHILKRHGGLHGTYRISGMNQELKRHYNMNCKYSYKKNYWEAIEKFDSDAVSYVDRYKVMRNAEESGVSVEQSRNEKNGFIGNIAEACRTIGYTESKLYVECDRMLHGE